MMRPESGVCLLTGATGGIGAKLAEVLSAEGKRLILSARSTERLESLRSNLPPASVVDVVAADLTRTDEIERLAGRAIEDEVDTLINLSGANELKLLQDQSCDAITRLVELNLLAPMRLTRLLLPTLCKRPSGLIVNVGSAFGSIGHPAYTAYCASKFGLRGFSEALRRELSDTGVDVVYVAPRATATEMNSPAAREMNKALGIREDAPERVAKAIARAMRRRTPSAYIGWPEKLFARINQILPSAVDSAIARRLPAIKRFSQDTI